MHPNRPRQITSRYLNEDNNGDAGPPPSITETQSFFEKNAPYNSVTVLSNTQGGIVNHASIYCNLIKTTIGGVAKWDMFVNYDFNIVGGTAGDIQFVTSAAGTPDAVPLGLFQLMFGVSQYSTTGQLSPTIVQINPDGTLNLKVYNIAAGTNQRGNVSRSFIA